MKEVVVILRKSEQEQINRLLDAQQKSAHTERALVEAFLTDSKALLEEERKTVEAHLEVCASCRSLVNFRLDPQAQF